MKRKLLTVLFIVALLFCAGCLDFGDDVENTSPDEAQLTRCRAEMYLKPELKMKPMGFKILGSGIDDAIWFKFSTDVTATADIFNGDIVHISTFDNGFMFTSHMEDMDWWDVNERKLFGGSVELPNVKFMNVGIDKSATEWVVYIFWHEV